MSVTMSMSSGFPPLTQVPEASGDDNRAGLIAQLREIAKLSDVETASLSDFPTKRLAALLRVYKTHGDKRGTCHGVRSCGLLRKVGV